MKRFSCQLEAGQAAYFNESTGGGCVRAEEAMKVERELMAFERDGVFLRLWTWLFGFKVRT